MAKCPLCAAEITEDFGLIECANCAAQLIVHMDGRVEYSGGNEGEAVDQPQESEQLESPVHSNSRADFEFGDQPQEFEFPETQSGQREETVNGDLPDIGSLVRHQESLDDKTVALHGDPSEPTEVVDPPPIIENFEMPEDPTEKIQMPKAEPPKPTRKKPAPKVEAEAEQPIPAGSADLSDIARFGNSEASSLRDGSLRYNLRITGIDTADVREAFREAITDKKLVWDTDQIIRSLKDGEVRISNVTPPKAYMVISRLRNLPVQVYWEQYGIVQS